MSSAVFGSTNAEKPRCAENSMFDPKSRPPNQISRDTKKRQTRSDSKQKWKEASGARTGKDSTIKPRSQNVTLESMPLAVVCV